MKKLLICVAMFALAQFATGCMFFPKTYDGSEKAYTTHPEWTDHTPAYMQNDPDQP